MHRQQEKEREEKAEEAAAVAASSMVLLAHSFGSAVASAWGSLGAGSSGAGGGVRVGLGARQQRSPLEPELEDGIALSMRGDRHTPMENNPMLMLRARALGQQTVTAEKAPPRQKHAADLLRSAATAKSGEGNPRGRGARAEVEGEGSCPPPSAWLGRPGRALSMKKMRACPASTSSGTASADGRTTTAGASLPSLGTLNTPTAPLSSHPDSPSWLEHVDESSGRTYYSNKVTGETVWERPAVVSTTV